MRGRGEAPFGWAWNTEMPVRDKHAQTIEAMKAKEVSEYGTP